MHSQRNCCNNRTLELIAICPVITSLPCAQSDFLQFVIRAENMLKIQHHNRMNRPNSQKYIYF